MTDHIRISNVAQKMDSRETPIDVCDHISLPNAYEALDGGYEYSVPLKMECKECGEGYAFVVLVN